MAFPVTTDDITNFWAGSINDTYPVHSRISAVRSAEAIWRSYPWKDGSDPFQDDDTALLLRGVLIMHGRYILLANDDEDIVMPVFVSQLTAPYLTIPLDRDPYVSDSAKAGAEKDTKMNLRYIQDSQATPLPKPEYIPVDYSGWRRAV